MSDSQASLIESKRIDGKLHENNDFETTDGKIWRQKSKLGKGGYSLVYLYEDENSGSLWAVKSIKNISGGGRTSSAELENEKAALIKFSDHERFVRFNGWFAHKNIEYFALEYMELGDLEHNLKQRERPGKNILNIIWEMIRGENKKDEVRLPEAEVKTILTQILEGLEFMHAEGYIHRDLKPQNILVAQKGPEWQVKITDLGLSKYTVGVPEGYSFTGTPQYMAPEIYNSMLDRSKYTNAIDLWAVGCIACRMLIGKPPFSDPWLLVQYLEAIKVSKPMDQLCKEIEYIPKDLAGLLDIKTSKGLFVRQLLEPEPGNRLSARHTKDHPWLQGHDFCTLQGHGKDVQKVAFSPNGKLLAWTSHDCTVRLWSVEECKSKYIFKSPEFGVFKKFLRDSTLVVCGIGTGLVRVWDTGTGLVKNEMQLPTYTLECSSDGSLVAAALENGNIELWDTERGDKKHVFSPTWKADLFGIKLSSNGEVMAVAHSAGCTILRKTGKESQERTFSGVPSWNVHVFFSPNNRVMALANHEGIFLGDEACFWDKHGQASKRISGSSSRVDRIVFSRDSKSAALVGPGCEIRLYNTGQEEEMRVLKGHSNHVMSMAFSPICPLLASASWDHTVILWDTEKGEKLCTLKAHSDGVKDVAFSPNGEFVATGSEDGMVGLWNVSRWNNRKDQE